MAVSECAVESQENLPVDEAAMSVIMPINGALPYLAVAVRDMLKQDLGDFRRLEVVLSWDGGAAEDWQWLEALAKALGSERCSTEAKEPAENTPVGMLSEPIEAHRMFTSQQETKQRSYPSVEEVAASCRKEHTVRILRYKDGLNRGQGAAMSLGVANCTGGVVAQMEADDSRPRSDAFRKMLDALRDNEDWDGVCTEAFCFGDTVSRNMTEYCEWQNSLREPEQLAVTRFVEIPALHQTAAFRRDALFRVNSGIYRDGTSDDDSLDTPVDLWWWLDFFDKGLRCGRIVGSTGAHPIDTFDPPQNTFFGWRQHATQRTRAHDRLSIDNLRRIKIHYILKAYSQRDKIIVVSVGKTLASWHKDLTGKFQGEVEMVQWRPSKRPISDNNRNDESLPPDRALRSFCVEDSNASVLRLWAYGSARVRRRVSLFVPDWDPANDLFVA